ARYRASGELVKKDIYEAVARQSAEDQVRIADLQRQLQAVPGLHADLGRAHYALDRTQRDLEEVRAENKDLRADVRRHRNGLANAVAEYAALQGQLKTLADELSTTRKSSRASAILGAVAAFTGVITVAHFLSNDDTDEVSPAPPKKRTRKARPQ